MCNSPKRRDEPDRGPYHLTALILVRRRGQNPPKHIRNAGLRLFGTGIGLTLFYFRGGDHAGWMTRAGSRFEFTYGNGDAGHCLD